MGGAGWFAYGGSIIIYENGVSQYMIQQSYNI